MKKARCKNPDITAQLQGALLSFTRVRSHLCAELFLAEINGLLKKYGYEDEVTTELRMIEFIRQMLKLIVHLGHYLQKSCGRRRKITEIHDHAIQAYFLFLCGKCSEDDLPLLKTAMRILESLCKEKYGEMVCWNLKEAYYPIASFHYRGESETMEEFLEDLKGMFQRTTLSAEDQTILLQCFQWECLTGCDLVSLCNLNYEDMIRIPDTDSLWSVGAIAWLFVRQTPGSEKGRYVLIPEDFEGFLQNFGDPQWNGIPVITTADGERVSPEKIGTLYRSLEGVLFLENRARGVCHRANFSCFKRYISIMEAIQLMQKCFFRSSPVLSPLEIFCFYCPNPEEVLQEAERELLEE